MNPEQHEFERDVLQLLCERILKSHIFQTRLLGDGDVRAFDNRNNKWRQIAAECERSAKFFFWRAQFVGSNKNDWHSANSGASRPMRKGGGGRGRRDTT